jgi:nucleoside-triphosphatase
MAYGIVGSQGCGKTTAATQMALHASRRGVSIGGIVAPVVYEGTTRVGYDLVDLGTGARAPWLRVGEGAPIIGPFGIVASGVALARQALEAMLHSPVDLGIIDEVGEWELAGGGHAWVMDRLAEWSGGLLILVMRDRVVESVVARWGLRLQTWPPSELTALEAALRMGED